MRRCALALVLLASACSASARTQVMVEVDAEPAVRAETTQLELRVLGGVAGTDPALWAVRHEATVTDFSWPRRIALVPIELEPARGYQVEIRAARADGTTVTSSAIRGGYATGRTKLLVLLLEDACAGVECGTMRCQEGRCVDPLVDVNAAPDLVGDDAGI